MAICVIFLQSKSSDLTGFTESDRIPFFFRSTCPVASIHRQTIHVEMNMHGKKNKKKKRHVILFLEAYCTLWWRMGWLFCNSERITHCFSFFFFMLGGYSCLVVYMLDLLFPPHWSRAKKSAIVPAEKSCCLIHVGGQGYLCICFIMMDV